MTINSKRNIAFFTLEVNDSIDVNVKEFVTSLITKISSLDKKDRKYNLSDDRFCFLKSGICEQDLIKCLFISAKHGTRLPLINEENLESRDNPKTKHEGEEIHTHMLLKITNNDCYVLLEQGRDLLQMKNICEYFNNIYNRTNNTYNTNPLLFSLIPSDSFEETLNNKMSRLSLGEIYVDKQLLGSDSLNFSDRIETVKDDIIIQIKPQRCKDIKSVLVDISKKFRTNQSLIKRIRIKGKTENGTDCVADTLMHLIKKQSIRIQKDDETGAVNSTYIFSQMKEISYAL